jgi:adenylosuccinate synthase
VVNDKKYIFHLLPAGILYPDKLCVIGNGVVFDPEEFFNEIEAVTKEGIPVKDRLFVSDRAHVVLPYHKALDLLREKRRGKGKIGTTGRGIGPAYADKVSRVGVRVADLLCPETLEVKLTEAIAEKKILFAGGGADESFDQDIAAIMKSCLIIGKRLQPYICDTSLLCNEKMREGKHLLFEGAQGTYLDIDHGTYPFVTSSNTVAGAACAGSGIGPSRIDEVYGVVKAYTTRVGSGPFPTEFDATTGDKIRELGGEFGATTGRPRRCGWLDAVMLRRSVDLNGLDALVITKLDVLDTLDSIKVAVAYKLRGKEISCFPATNEDVEKLEPVYETFPGWKSSTTQCKRYADLPENAKKYVSTISRLVGAKVAIVSVGPDRTQTLAV